MEFCASAARLVSLDFVGGGRAGVGQKNQNIVMDMTFEGLFVNSQFARSHHDHTAM